MSVLTTNQAQQCARRLPEAFRAAMEDRSLTGLNICLEGVEPGQICHPLREEQLGAIRSCVSFARRESLAEPVTALNSPEKGLLVFRVRYDVAGWDADGNAVEVQEEGALALTCALRGDERLCILEAEPWRLLEDGSVKRPGWLERRLRRWQRRTRRDGVAETLGEGLPELLGAVVEFLLESLFDGV